MRTYYVDGQFVPADKAVIPVNDLAVLRGYGVCDIMRTYAGRPFFLEDHIRRLEASAGKIGLSLPWSSKDIKNIVIQTLKKNHPIDEANIRIVITGGSSSDFFSPDGAPRMIIMITDIPRLPKSWYEKGVKVVTIRQERSLPEAKILSYGTAAMALKQAKKQGAIEAIYINSAGQALECTTSNLFAFEGDTLLTPKTGVLKGITRQAVLTLAKKHYKIGKQAISLERLLSADEIFITGTNKGVVPVVQIDDTRIGRGKPGERTKVIISALEKHSQEFIQK